MLATFTLAAALLSQSDETPKRWVPLTNLPGWEGYGTILPTGWIEPERFRRTVYASPSVPVAEDPHGFVGWLNSQRSMRGLSAVGYDPGLSSWAALNSAAGFGHSVRAGRRQNAGVGSLESVCTGWLASPAHAAALFDPSITRVGIAVVNGCWTMNGD